ncbi:MULTISPECIES: helix-turn-helix domain-containing protein [Paenibacillus]|uniref:Transcriptional regulator, HxlR family n=1 Tax=Paenibacillus typhae TaxID=1174501 RepID=A0A1G8UQ45_9BACL|nr:MULTISPECIES: helix-turn-helix domain-containing protein [Paenibacillus]MDF9839130.1 DNA-binding HxlR family transcriptional regulator [Paenibacillus sp. PastF-2]MDF9845712.1 DNA-binding HxlR family transcriptional regulator [Paenibacillus sp. PastM-2]MDF9852284.1 DNA-binding HxlR family transcriptional regulator [Paenibacillus sp. PastF-1]MDH6477987.1 DNA-binding HxlR family transcriptional regulator [Paenibacillus sp. PastH-2]MDH6505722.1 DNA-binding HxlR family transcriptional regulator 
MNEFEMCPRFEKAVDVLSKRWVALIVFVLMQGPRRFGEIEGCLSNLSGKVLSDRLKEMENEGIIQRTVYPEMPVRIEYSLTAKGNALAPILGEISSWSSEWIELGVKQ